MFSMIILILEGVRFSDYVLTLHILHCGTGDKAYIYNEVVNRGLGRNEKTDDVRPRFTSYDKICMFGS